MLRVRVDHDSPSTASDAITYSVRLNDATTAGSVVGEVFLAMHFEARKKDIVSSVRPSSHSRSSSGGQFAADVSTFLQHHWLYEVGGYIGWRQLEHNVNVTAVCQENPLAEWIVRCHHNR